MNEVLARILDILARQQAAVLALGKAMPNLNGDALIAVERTTEELARLVAGLTEKPEQA